MNMTRFINRLCESQQYFFLNNQQQSTSNQNYLLHRAVTSTHISTMHLSSISLVKRRPYSRSNCYCLLSNDLLLQFACKCEMLRFRMCLRNDNQIASLCSFCYNTTALISPVKVNIDDDRDITCYDRRKLFDRRKRAKVSAKTEASTTTTTRPTTITRTKLLRWMLSIVFVLMLTNAEYASACGPGRRSNARRNPRKLTPLVFKQHIPNVSENTLGASGLSDGRVSRHHKRFKELVPNYNPDIIFKDDEGTGADRLMTQRLKEKLNTLAISVMNQWPGIKLRVTQAWHEGNAYNGDSLHYEGRAVDITTSDKDRSKLGMLARLAVEAGFDWVYYETRVWIHCSVRSEKSDSARNGGCFDEKSVVYDHNGPKPIKDLQIGDRVLSASADGRLEYSEVLMFLDRDPTTERLYYHLWTESGASVTATPSHLLFVGNEDDEGDNRTVAFADSLSRPQFVRDILVGQYLYTRNQAQLLGAAVKPDRVVRITTSRGRGAYAPLTTNGNLIVNNVTVSCYALIRSQSLSHLCFAPIRFAYFFVELGDSISNILLGSRSTSSRTEKNRSITDATTTPIAIAQSDGVHWYARLLYRLFKHLIPSHTMFS